MEDFYDDGVSVENNKIEKNAKQEEDIPLRWKEATTQWIMV